MPVSRNAEKTASPAGPVLNAFLIVLAMAFGLWLLVRRGNVSWPPTNLLASAYTVAGCLALAGPVILARREAPEGAGLGELAWMTAGLLIWIHNLVAAIKGDYRAASWPTPLAAQALGLTVLAVVLAAWRLRPGGRNWSWTNVLGWVLGLFWIGMGVVALWPSRGLGLTLR
jgi:hypothetical protein